METSGCLLFFAGETKNTSNSIRCVFELKLLTKDRHWCYVDGGGDQPNASRGFFCPEDAFF
jgi:hypothetical protein